MQHAHTVLLFLGSCIIFYIGSRGSSVRDVQSHGVWLERVVPEVLPIRQDWTLKGVAEETSTTAAVAKQAYATHPASPNGNATKAVGAVAFKLRRRSSFRQRKASAQW